MHTGRCCPSQSVLRAWEAETAAQAWLEGYAETGHVLFFSSPGVFLILWQSLNLWVSKLGTGAEQAQDYHCKVGCWNQLAWVMTFLCSYIYRHQECQLWRWKQHILSKLMHKTDPRASFSKSCRLKGAQEAKFCSLRLTGMSHVGLNRTVTDSVSRPWPHLNVLWSLTCEPFTNTPPWMCEA